MTRPALWKDDGICDGLYLPVRIAARGTTKNNWDCGAKSNGRLFVYVPDRVMQCEIICVQKPVHKEGPLSLAVI